MKAPLSRKEKKKQAAIGNVVLNEKEDGVTNEPDKKKSKTDEVKNVSKANNIDGEKPVDIDESEGGGKFYKFRMFNTRDFWGCHKTLDNFWQKPKPKNWLIEKYAKTMQASGTIIINSIGCTSGSCMHSH